jgi:2-dehydro-3-deoxygluconokinase
MSVKVVTFGELMLRLTPPNYERLSQSRTFNIYYGGAEANVAATLAQLGINACFTTKLPNNDIGKGAVNYCSSFGINTNYIVYGGERLGIYFCEDGISQRSSSIIYDRKNSSIATVKEDDFNWDNILNDALLFHYTGITAGLSDNVRSILLIALKKAKEKNIFVSCDLNYRARLWSKEEANKVMTEYMKYTDILIANEEDAEKVFNISSGSDVESGSVNIEGYKKVAEELFDRYQLKLVASHLRESRSATDNGWQVILYDGKTFAISKKYNIHVLDRVGAGDAFVAGLIYSYLDNKNLQEIAEFAAASGCLKHSVHGDFNIVNIAEIENLAKGSGAGRVKR